MKKKKYIYIIIIIITLFSFNNQVNADLASEAKEKSCEELIEEGILDTSNQSILFDKGDREINCGYMKTETSGIIFKSKSCIILQLAYNKDGSDLEISSLRPNPLIYASYVYKTSWKDYPELDANYLINLEGVCPVQIKYSDFGTHAGNQFLFGGSNNMKKMFSTQLNISIPPLIGVDPDYNTGSCKDIIGEKGVSALKTVKNLIIIAVPLILIVLATLDLVKAVFSSDEGAMKKAQGKLIKRIIITIIVLLSPSILKFILDIAHEIWPNIDSSLCGIYD